MCQRESKSFNFCDWIDWDTKINNKGRRALLLTDYNINK